MQAMEDGAPPSQVLLRCGLYASAAAGLITITLCRNMVLPYASVRAERLSLAEQLHEALREGHSPTLKTLVRALLSSAPAGR